MGGKETLLEILVRVALLVFYIWLDFQDPFVRVIQTEEWWLYKNPHTGSPDVSVTTRQLFWIAFFVPCCIIMLFEAWDWRRKDAATGLLGITSSILINGILTNIIKLMVGRPRPDFFERCFPDGKPLFEGLTPMCSGDADSLSEGRKSFPSGHSSWSFAGLIFLSYYLAGKLQSFSSDQPRSMLKLVTPILPALVALYVALSRYCDYWHHYQDVVWGSVLGSLVASLCYFFYYPSLSHPECDRPLQSSLNNRVIGKTSNDILLSRAQSFDKLHTIKVM